MGRRYPGLAALCGAVGGILIADISRLDATWFLCAALITLLLALIAWRRQHLVVLSILLVVTVAGLAGFRYADNVYDLGPASLDRNITDYQRYRVFGKVIAWPELRGGNMEIILRADSLISDRSFLVRGNILLRLFDSSTAVQMGDRLEFVARLQRISRGADPTRSPFAARMHRKGIRAQCYLLSLHDARVSHRAEFTPLAIADKMRERIAAMFSSSLPPHSAALASGFFLGETRNIPPETYRLFRDSGTLHLLAVSGSNVALVLGVVALALRPFRVPIQRRRLILLLVVGLFAYLTYLQPSVIRASVMAALVLCAGLLDRRHDLVQILFVAAFFILMVSPAHLYDVGFQLSFAGAFAMVFLVPRWLEPLKEVIKKQQPSPIISPRFLPWVMPTVMPAVVSIAAFTLTMPLIAAYFERVPWLTPLTNLVIVPLVAVSTIGSVVLLIGALVSPMLGHWLGALLDQVLDLIIWLLRRADSSSSVLTSTVPDVSAFTTAVLLIAWMGALITATLSLRAHRLLPRAAMIGLGAAVLLLANTICQHQDHPEAYVQIAPISGGQGILIVRGDHSADIVLSDLQAGPTPFRAGYLNPLLKGTSKLRIDRAILHSVDHPILPELLAALQNLSATEFYLPSSYSPIVRDFVAGGQVDSLVLPQITWYEGVWRQPVTAGLYLSELGVLLSTVDAAIVAAPRVPDLVRLTLPPAQVTLCVPYFYRRESEPETATPWPPVGQIVCNRLTDLDQPPGAAADSARPKLLELYTTGPLRLPFLAVP